MGRTPSAATRPGAADSSSAPPAPAGAASLVAVAALLAPGFGPSPLPAQDSSPAGVEWTAEAVYVAEASTPLRGGVDGGWALLGNLDLLFELRSPGHDLVLHAYALGNHGDAPSELVGDAQGVSNIEAPAALRLFEAWVEKGFREGGISLLAGLYDLNSEFDVIETGAILVNSSFGIGPDFSQSGVAGPSIFPVTSLALRARWEPSPSFYLQGAVLDAVPGDPGNPGATSVRLSAEEGALLAFEAGWRPSVGPEGVEGKLALGTWHYTRSFPTVSGADGERRRARPGVYALAETPLWRERDVAQGMAAFARVGWADPRVHRFEAYTGVGATYTGLLPGRDRDGASAGVAVAWNGEPFRSASAADGVGTTRAETVVEVTYRWEGAGWAIQPDLQWVVNPDTRSGSGDVWLFGLRLEAGAVIQGTTTPRAGSDGG